MKTKNIWFWAVALVAIALDQITKLWVASSLEYRVDEIEVIPGFFSIVHAQNPGAAIGILSEFEYRYLLFIGFTIVAVVIIVNMQRQLAEGLRFLPTVLGLIMGGAIGNGIDRLHQGVVTDFLRFYTENPGIVDTLRGWGLPAEYPSFNIADSALVVGVGLFVVHYLFLDDGELDGKQKGEGKDPKSSEAETEPDPGRRTA